MHPCLILGLHDVCVWCQTSKEIVVHTFCHIHVGEHENTDIHAENELKTMILIGEAELFFKGWDVL